MKHYYYKVWYRDNTYDYLESSVELKPSMVCHTCVAVARISAIKYYCAEIWGTIKYSIIKR